MTVRKSGVQMDYWRDYFRSANANIFEIIEGAIMLAASDCPKEFKVRRDSIAQILFSCRLIKCSGCDKEELALPVDNQDHHHDHDHHHHHDGDEGVRYKSKLVDVDRNCSKESSKVINCSRNDDNDDQRNHHVDHQVSNYSYGDAEALTDEIEQESQTFGEVMRIKEIVDNSPDESASVLCNSLRKLQLMSISVETLKATEIGKSVNVLRKHASKDVRQIARTLIEVWKEMVDEWVNATAKMTVSENTPESMNPSVLDEEEGLPSPPLDDLAFLNPHSISLELSEKFFDDVDDYGNPRKNENRNNGKPPPVEKHNVTKLKQQKPLNGTTKVSKPTMVKPPVVGSPLGRRTNPNMDRKLQNPEKPSLPKRPAVPQQRKPMSLDGETEQDKLEATKRKLQERYQQAENVKRQRTIQVMELHDLPKQDVTIRNQHTRPGHHYRHWANSRF
ncbi:putative transcription regulator IWS1 family [Helianthus annuus]|uniref:Putative transcription factor IIS n=1 Tax=Helianthus annuus TaxID=4232 RepID=A0A251SSN0_HELAN|nr:probable mediator of RNA polymerase II transcription subunit 26b [Helianthus annuus]KAJ0477240.1 putative transcription regulator IWS1 family [Helianthus annuus]KAJ0481630.1 putative transcription regulator IWS1 family [Helianthus annuus]KAJ0498067.1 putative transcription regulator IWS1 family [Helianthus annuus]KAJ0664066.1 putative transcription regulator IWS1 family [Helianthus annuus]